MVSISLETADCSTVVDEYQSTNSTTEVMCRPEEVEVEHCCNHCRSNKNLLIVVSEMDKEKKTDTE